MYILTIADGLENGKGCKPCISFHFYYYIYDCKIINNKLYIKGNLFNINRISTIIFNFNEDKWTYKNDKKLQKKFSNIREMICLFKNISFIIKKYYPSVTIYNDPYKCFSLGNKVKVYNQLKNIKNNLFRIPRYTKILCVNDLNKINYYPVIIKFSNGSHTQHDTVCKNYKELKNTYIKHFQNKPNVFVVKYINSFICKFNCFHSIRFMVINGKLLDYYFRPSNNWNIHTKDQIKDKILQGSIYLENYIKKNKCCINKYLSNTQKIYGNGFFSYDIILNGRNKKLYICEIGLKIFDDVYYNLTHNKMRLSKNLNKLSQEEYSQKIKKILNFKFHVHSKDN